MSIKDKLALTNKESNKVNKKVSKEEAKNKKLSSFKEKYSKLLEDSVKKEPTKEEKELEKKVRVYRYTSKLVKKIASVLNKDTTPLFLFLLLDMFVISLIDFDKPEEEQSERYAEVFNTLLDSISNLAYKEDLNENDIIKEFL